MAASRIELAAQEILRERATATKAYADPRDFLFDRQKEVIACSARMLAILAGRRGAKTVVAGAKLLLAAMQNPRSLSVYLALSRESAQDIMWPEMVAWGERLGIPAACFNDSKMRIYLPNGSRIVITGTDDMRTIERWRGGKLACVVIDECGAQPESILTMLITSILRPALIDLQGAMWLIGTPGFVGSGYWWDLTGPERVSKAPLFSDWTMLDNPHIPHAANELREILADEGWRAPPDICIRLGLPLQYDTSKCTHGPVFGHNEECELLPPTATFMREYLGRWCIDVGELVYPYSDALCGIDELPLRNQAGCILDSNNWRFVIGVDVGVVDDTAISVVAANSDDVRDFIIETEKHQKMLTNALADRLRQLRVVYKGAPVVIDSGGMGKYHATSVQEQFGVGVIAAEKVEKASHIRIFRDRMLSQRVAILRGACNDAIRDEYTRIAWDKNKLLPKKDAVDHSADSVLYAWRYLRNYVKRDKVELPPKGSAEWHILIAKEIQAKMETEIRKAREEVTNGGILSMFENR